MASMAAKHRLLVLIGSLGPLGYMPASGTVTVAVAGIPAFWLMSSWPVWVLLAFAVVFALASVWLHQVGDRILGEKDSRKLVWDELAGFFFAIAWLPFTWQVAVAVFLVERAIDIVKVPPARQIENRWPGGWGVVGDDIVAGIYACVVLHIAIRLLPAWFGVA